MVKKVRGDAKDLIREALRGGKHTVKAAADAWLAWRYGWQQLGYDVANVYDFVSKPISSLVVEGRAGSSDTGSLSESHSYSWQSSSFTNFHEHNYDISYNANVVGILYGDTVNMVVNPFTTAWEIVPYSFVADWFVNVGDVLASWEARLRLKRLYCSLGRKLTITTAGRVIGVGPGTSSSFTGQSWSGVSQERYESRERIPTGVPSKVPSITVNLTSKRILDAAALLAKRIF
jgi:hypothetical protein